VLVVVVVVVVEVICQFNTILAWNQYKGLGLQRAIIVFVASYVDNMEINIIIIIKIN